MEWFSLIGAVASLFIGIFSFLKGRLLSAARERRHALQKRVDEAIDYHVEYEVLDPAARSKIGETWLSGSIALLEDSKTPEDQGAHQEVERRLGKLKKRIKNIEQRLPATADRGSLAPMTEALLEERIGHLCERLDAIENQILSRWDIALVVSAIITGIIIIVGATYGILKAVGVIPP